MKGTLLFVGLLLAASSPMECTIGSAKEIIIVNGKNYTFFPTPVSWYDAQFQCAALELQLLTLDDQAKSDAFIRFQLDNPSYDVYTWIALHRNAQEADFLWSPSGASPTYTAWGASQPSVPQLFAACADFSGTYGAWDDNNCGVSTFACICEDV